MNNPTSNVRIEGRVKQRKLRPKPQYAKLIANLEKKGMRDLIKGEWFDVVYEDKEWTENLITSKGLSYLKTSSAGFGKIWDYYQFGTGTGVPSLSSTSLSSYYSYCHTKLDLPSEYKANDYNYTTSRVTNTRTWLSSVIESPITVTEGGFSYDDRGNLLSRFLLDTPIDLETGDYYAPIYQLIMTLSPALSPITLPAPFIGNVDISASAQLESLLTVLPPVNRQGYTDNNSYYSVTGNDSSYDTLFREIGITASVYFTPVSSDDNESANTSYYNIIVYHLGYTTSGLNSLMWTSKSYYYAGGDAIYGPQIYLVFATDSTSLSFTEEGHIVQGILGAYRCPLATYGAGSDYFSGSDYSTLIRQVFDGSNGNHEGIRSIAWCIKESPVGSTDWQYRSLYRILLDEPLTKEAGKILTLDFKRSWA